MKAVTIQQPWAWCIAAGYKLVENRTWETKYRGPLAIHAGRTVDTASIDMVKSMLVELGVIPNMDTAAPSPHLKATGAVVAVVDLVGVCTDSCRCYCGVWAAMGAEPLEARQRPRAGRAGAGPRRSGPVEHRLQGPAMTAVEPGLFPEPERTGPRRDGPWLIGPAPECWRYLFVGEDGEQMLVHGHRVDAAGVLGLLEHSGAGSVTEWLDDDDLRMRREWACELSQCPLHDKFPQWLRKALMEAVNWSWYQVWRALWKLWLSRDPLKSRWKPRMAAWLQRRWRAFADCQYCEWVQHYRSDPGATFWTWADDLPFGSLREPITVVDLEA